MAFFARFFPQIDVLIEWLPAWSQKCSLYHWGFRGDFLYQGCFWEWFVPRALLNGAHSRHWPLRQWHSKHGSRPPHPRTLSLSPWLIPTNTEDTVTIWMPSSLWKRLFSCRKPPSTTTRRTIYYFIMQLHKSDEIWYVWGLHKLCILIKYTFLQNNGTWLLLQPLCMASYNILLIHSKPYKMLLDCFWAVFLGSKMLSSIG